MTKISILTLNAALLQVQIFRIPLFSFSPYASERADRIIENIQSTNTDIVCLQEISGNYVKKIIEGLRDVYPHSIYEKSYKVFSSDLLILSKYPLHSPQFVPFRDMTWFEKMVINKGILGADIHLGSVVVHIACTHLITNGFPLGATLPAVESIRDREIKEIKKYAEDKENMILVGDFNASPEASKGNYDSLLESFEDLFIDSEDAEGKKIVRMTWDPQNPLVQTSVDRKSPAQRVDAIFVPKTVLGKLMKLLDTHIVFNTELYKSHDKKLIPISDHYGIITTLEIRESK